MKTQKQEKEVSRATRLKNILVPIDFSTAAHKAFRYGLDLAKQYRSKILLLHVVTPSEPDSAVKAAKRKLAGFCKSEGVQAGRCKLIVRTGTPFFEITHGSNGDRADLIVLGGPAVALREPNEGHTLERVLRYAKCPVLLVREDDRHFVAHTVKGRVRSSK